MVKRAFWQIPMFPVDHRETKQDAGYRFDAIAEASIQDGEAVFERPKPA